MSTATAKEPANYLVVTPCVIVKGRRGSHGTFYEGQQIKPWPSADAAEDQADAAELARLERLGFVREVPAE